MSYLGEGDFGDGYNGSEGSSASFYDALASANPEFYSPYCSDPTLSSSFFNNSSGSISSASSVASVSDEAASDPYVWNNKFQTAIAAVRQLETQTVAHRTRAKTWASLASLAADFIHAATTYGKIIISEAYLPAEEKTIRPLSGRGIAGGEKYIVNSIMFKFAIDSSNLFGGDDHKASRVAGHDLLGLNCYLASVSQDLHLPLVCLLDYRGFRLVALSLLPISRTTLVYGSDDAGRCIRTDPLVHEQLVKCAQAMNTNVHDVVELGSGEKRSIAAALDVEVHRSELDGRSYIIDCSRTMPPSADCKDTRYKGACNHLTMLLRPELVKHFPRPLCNDAFSVILCPKALLMRLMQEKQNSKNATSSTGNLRLDDIRPSHPNSTISSTPEHASHYHDPDDDLVAYGSNPLSYFEAEPSPPSPSPLSFVTNSFDITTEYIEELAAKKTRQEADIEEATNQLLNQTIPKFAEQLQRMLASFPPTQQSIFAYEWLVVWLHWNGINIRHLGTLRANIPKENNTLRGLLLNIMISRVLKNMSNHRLRMEMRRLKYAGDYPYQQTLISFLNTVFGTSTESLTFWNTHLKHALLYQFPDALTPQETNLDLRVLALDSPIINKDSQSLHTRHSPIPPSTPFSKEHSPETSISSPSKRSVDAQAATESLPFKATSAAFIRDLIKEGGDFDLPIEPICFLFFSFCRLVGLNLKASHMKSFASNPALFDVAEPLNVLDLSGAPQKVKTLQIVSHAEGLVWKVRAEAASAMPKSQQFAVGLWKLSLESYKQSLLANPRDQRTIRNVAEVYHALGMQELAGAFAHLAIETNPDDPVSLYKYATFIYSTTKNVETSKRYFEAAIRATPTTPGAILAYAEFCLKLGRIPQAASLVERCVADFPNSWDGLHKLAYLNHTVLKDYDKAHEYYKKAIEIECKDLVLLAHYVAFLKDIIKDESLAASYELFMKKLEQKTTIAGRGSKLWDMAMK